MTTSPVMAFIDTSETVIGVEIPQINARYIQPGQMVELTFQGTVYAGKVEAVLQAISSGQVQPSGMAVDVQALQFQFCATGTKTANPMVRSPGRLPHDQPIETAVLRPI